MPVPAQRVLPAAGAVIGNRGCRVGHIPDLEGQVDPLDVVFLASGRVETDIALGVRRKNAADVVDAFKVGIGGRHGIADRTVLHRWKHQSRSCPEHSGFSAFPAGAAGCVQLSPRLLPL